jgi:hypothetical protein
MRRRSPSTGRTGAGGALRILAWSAMVMTVATAGCKSIPPPPSGSGGSGSGGSGSGSGGSTGGGGSDAGSGPSDMKFTSGETGPDGACSTVRSSAKLVPLDLYVMMDSSKSMNDTDSNGKAKWEDLKSAMSGFFNDANSAGFSVALKYFPDEQPDVPETCAVDGDCKAMGPCDQRKACVQTGAFSMSPSTLCTGPADCASTETCVPVQHCTMGPNCMARNCVAAPDAATKCPSDCQPFTGYCRGRDICAASTYATPTVPFGELPGAAGDLVASLNAHAPSGYTPTGPALTGALQAAKKRAMDNPEHQVAVVLVTDGLPGAFIPGMAPAACTPADAPGVADLLSGKLMSDLGLAGKPPIPTFVIGIFGPCDLQQGNTQMPKEKLTTWATAGGTMSAVIVDTSLDVTKQIQEAFKQVQSKVITCQYAIPQNVVGGIAYKKVSVDYKSTAMPTPAAIRYVGSKDKCDPSSGGWYYDVDPNVGTPTQIIACDKSCSEFKAAEGAEVNVTLGCADIF